MKTRVAIVALALGCLCLPGPAQADGDPASDFLLVRSVFLPYYAKIDSHAVQRLDDAVTSSDQAGFRIKVALIAQPYDLGSVFQLYGKPRQYAQFLGQELAFSYRGRLLVVMPNGFGYAEGGKPNARLARALAGLRPPGRDPTKLAEAGTTAVRRLASAAGHRLAPPKPIGGGGSETSDRIVIAAAVAIGLALVAGAAAVRRALARRRTLA